MRGWVLGTSTSLSDATVGARLDAGSPLHRIPAAPAAAVLAADGSLAYLGPYSLGPACGAGEGPVEAVLDELLRGGDGHWPNALGAGCLCPWRPGRRAAGVLT